MSDPHLFELADLFRLLGDASRLSIVLCCMQSPVAVMDIANQTALSQSLVSHHLRLLKAARIVKAQRQGRQIFYQVADFHISAMLSNMIEHMQENHHDHEQDLE